MTKKSTLLKKLTSYSALATAAVAVSQKSDGQIIYHDINPDTVIHVHGHYLLDLNGDDTTDFNLGIARNTNVSFGPYNIPLASASNANGVEQDAAITSGIYAFPNSFSTKIGGADTWVAKPHLDDIRVNTKANKGIFAGKGDKYVGLELSKSGKTYYGWVRVKVSALGDTLTIKDYAYNAIADSVIKAGEGQPAGIAPLTIEAAVLEPGNPNPATTVSNIIYTIPVYSSVTVELYDVMGRKVETVLDNAMQSPGRHTLPVDVSKLSSGVYFYSLIANGQAYTQKFAVTH